MTKWYYLCNEYSPGIAVLIFNMLATILVHISWKFTMFSENLRGYLKKHCTNTRLVFTHFSYPIQTWQWQFDFWKKLFKFEESLICTSELDTSVVRVKKINSIVNWSPFYWISLQYVYKCSISLTWSSTIIPVFSQVVPCPPTEGSTLMAGTGNSSPVQSTISLCST